MQGEEKTKKNVSLIVISLLLLGFLQTIGDNNTVNAVTPSADWLHETVDTNVRSYNYLDAGYSLALDREGYPHIVCCKILDSGVSELRYAHWNGSAWSESAVDYVDEDEVSMSIAVDSAGNPHILYADNFVPVFVVGNGNLTYASWNGTSWNKSILRSATYFEVFNLIIDSNDIPHMLYREYYFSYEYGSDHYLMLQVGDSTSYVYDDWNGAYALRGSLALDLSDNDHVLYSLDSFYSDFDHADLYYDGAKIGSHNGTALITSGSLAVDPFGNPYIVYSNYSSGAYCFFYATRGPQWSIKQIGNGYNPCIAVDITGKPQITFIDCNYDLNYTKWVGFEWNSEIVASMSVGNSDYYSCLVLDQNNKPHVIYSDSHLEYATKARAPRSSLSLDEDVYWQWGSNTVVNSQVAADVDADGANEVITGGYYFDGSRKVAQLIVWNASTCEVENIKVFYWTDDTVINSVAVGNLDSDNQIEVVTGGYYFDGYRNVAQLCVWSGSSLALENAKAWFWTGNTAINSVALGDIDNDGATEIVTGGYYFDGIRNNAQIVELSGPNLTVDRIAGWYWTDNTAINSVAVWDVDSDGYKEVVSGGYYNDGVRDVAQLCVWNGPNLALENVRTWYWTSNTSINSVVVGDVDDDSQIEIVTGGYFNDGAKDTAQLVVWAGSSLASENLRCWCWSSDRINSLVLRDVDSDSTLDVVVGVNYQNGGVLAAQLVVWTGSSLSLKSYCFWQLTGATAINSVFAADVDRDNVVEIGTGGYCNGGNTAQIVTWEMR